MVVYDVNGYEHTITTKKEREHYTVEVDRHFYCSCDNQREVDEEIPGIVDLFKFSYVRR